MQKNIFLPQVELTMESVQVIGWLVKAGDQVKADQPILEVESQKGIVEVPSPETGIVRKLCVKKGDTIGEKALLCVLTDTLEEPAVDVAAPEPRTQQSAPRSSAAPSDSEGGIKAVPAARKLAKERGVALAAVKGTGPGGRITLEDVQNFGGGTQLSATRLALIAQMQKSLTEIPQFNVSRQMNVAPLAVKTEGITFTHRLVKATGQALAKHPVLRTVITGNQIKELPVCVAVAMDTGEGLLAPAIRGADQLTVEQIAAHLKDLRDRAMSGRVKRDELVDAPFAISNLGMLGIDFFTPFVFHGQTAVLGIGRAVDGKAWFTLAVDHRVVDGAEAARFLETLQHAIAGTSK